MKLNDGTRSVVPPARIPAPTQRRPPLLPEGGRPSRAEAGEKFGVDSSEPTIAENTDDIAGLSSIADVLDDRFNGGQVSSIATSKTKITDELFGIQPLLDRELLQSSHFGDHHLVGTLQRIDEFVLENVPAGGVRARLEDRP